MRKQELYVKLKDFPKVLAGKSFDCSEKFGDTYSVMMRGEFDAQENSRGMIAVLVDGGVKVRGKRVKWLKSTVIYPRLQRKWPWWYIPTTLKDCVDVSEGKIRLCSTVEIT